MQPSREILNTTQNTVEPAISIVLACYNEGGLLSKNLDTLLDFRDAIRDPVELIFIDDASSDYTPVVLEKRLRNVEGIRLLRHPVNVGRGGTVKEGMALCRGDYIGYIDIDLDVSEVHILQCVRLLKSGYDCVFGERFSALQFLNFHRTVQSNAYRALVRLVLGISTRDSECGLKFFRRDGLRRILPLTRNPCWFWDTEIVFQAERHALKTFNLPCLYARNPQKRSTVRFFSDMFEYIGCLVAFVRQNRLRM